MAPRHPSLVWFMWILNLIDLSGWPAGSGRKDQILKEARLLGAIINVSASKSLVSFTTFCFSSSMSCVSSRISLFTCRRGASGELFPETLVRRLVYRLRVLLSLSRICIATFFWTIVME